MPARVPIRLAGPRLRAFMGSGGLEAVARSVFRAARVRIGARAIGSHMRDAKGEGPRRADDRGNLRILKGTHAKAVRGGSPASVDRITATGARATLSIGLNLSLDPGGWNEQGTARAPARPTIVPGAKEELPFIQRMAAERLRAAVAQAIRGGIAGGVAA